MLSGDRLRALPFQNEGARLIRLVHSREEGFRLLFDKPRPPLDVGGAVFDTGLAIHPTAVAEHSRGDFSDQFFFRVLFFAFEPSDVGTKPAQSSRVTCAMG